MRVASRAVVASLAGIVLLGPATVVGAGPETPHLVEQAAASGIDHVYDGDRFYVGGGVAAFDCDADGKPELFLAGGSNAAALYHNDSTVGGALRFTQLPDPATDLVDATGAYPIDVDGDGVLDLVVLRLGEDVLLRGLGGCRFERANEAWGFQGGDAWTTAFSANWEGAASLPTLAFGDYVDLTDATKCADDVLVRPDAAGTGYGPPTALSPSWCTLSVLFSDWDRSGRRDLRVSNDRHYYRPGEGEEQLWRVASGEAPTLYTPEQGWAQVQVNGMGIASYDLTGDGYPEVFLTSMGESKLQTLVDGATEPAYKDIASAMKVAVPRPFTGGDVLPSTAWHPEFADVNNDGLIDLFISKGNLGGVKENATKDPSNLLLGTSDGTFTERARQAGILSYAMGRGAALADLNLDGLLDLVQVVRGDNVKLWRNVGAGSARKPKPMGDWLAVELHQPGPNPDAIGAWIEVRIGDRTMTRELTIGGGHAGGQLGWIHFGLGSAGAGPDPVPPQIRVQWPDGEWGPWMDIAPNSFARIERDAAAPVPWQPAG